MCEGVGGLHLKQTIVTGVLDKKVEVAGTGVSLSGTLKGVDAEKKCGGGA